MKNGKKNSVKIGSFNVDKDGFLLGRIYGLGMGSTPVLFEPMTSRDGKSYFRLIADPAKEGYEIGAAFPKDKDGMLWHTVSIDSPVLPAPINAALFPDREGVGYNLVWNRQDGNDLKADATPQPQHQAQSQSRGWSHRQPSPQ